MIYRMLNPLLPYDWGSSSYIQNLLGRKDLEGKPVAEMWLGAHPKAPSSVIPAKAGTGKGIHPTPKNLPSLIAADPQKHLGRRHDLFSDRLPFLLKILAARMPLSIQAHPNLKQAREGFKRENLQGIHLDAQERNYKDDNHKPELICALTPFLALCGFRAYEEIIANFRVLHLESVFRCFADFVEAPNPGALQNLFIAMLFSEGQTRKDHINRLLRALYLSTDEALNACIHRLAEHFPDDIGIYAPLFLNLIELKPAEAMYLEAGVLHAYLEGAGIEIMANSDNVLRGGLTPKHIDLQELARVVSFHPYSPSLIGNEAGNHKITDYDCPATEFHLQRLSLSEDEEYTLEDIDLPRILLCMDGTCICKANDLSVFLTAGQSIFVPADNKSLLVKGGATLFIASPSLQ
ncbi:MAG: mannose-6-phosphate isomerase, class I [Candidatus Cloacimonadaceae bacterium]|nr:mannose-6-phosphate isomerase, class I [Candidatus Cloacimonadaceae bacterium]